MLNRHKQTDTVVWLGANLNEVRMKVGMSFEFYHRGVWRFERCHFWDCENVSNEKWLKRQKQPVQEEEGQIKPILKCRGWKKKSWFTSKFIFFNSLYTEIVHITIGGSSLCNNVPLISQQACNNIWKYKTSKGTFYADLCTIFSFLDSRVVLSGSWFKIILIYLIPASLFNIYSFPFKPTLF